MADDAVLPEPHQETRPIEIGQVARRAVGLYRQRPGFLVAVGAVLFLPQALVDAFAGPSLAGALTGAVVSGAFIVIYAGIGARLAANSTAEARDLLQADVTATVRLLLAGLLIGLAVIAGTALLIVPGVYLATIWAVAPAVVVLEHRSAVASFGRSRQMVRGNFWPVLWASSLLSLPALVLGIGAGIAIHDATRALTTYVTYVLLLPPAMLVSGVLYIELREAATPIEPKDQVLSGEADGQPAPTASLWLLVPSYLTAIFLPIIGAIFGIVLLARRVTRHGIAVLLLSILFGVGFIVLSSNDDTNPSSQEELKQQFNQYRPCIERVITSSHSTAWHDCLKSKSHNSTKGSK